MRFLQAAILLVVSVMCCLADDDLPSPSRCADAEFPDWLKSESVSKVYQQYKDYLMMKNNTNMKGCKEITAFDFLSHALNTTGNESATASALNYIGASRSKCLMYLKFTLQEVALQNLKDPSMFPGKTTILQLLPMMFSNTTHTVLRDVGEVVMNLTKKNVNLTLTIHELIKEGHFNDQSKFFLVLCYAINASNFEATARQLLFEKNLLDVTMTEMTDRLFTNVTTYQKDLSLECAIRHLHSAKSWLMKFSEYLKEKRVAFGSQTIDDLFMKQNLTKNTTTVLALLKDIFSTKHPNYTFVRFFGARPVNLSVLDFKVSKLETITFVSADIICNYTLKELFDFAFMHSQLIYQYRINMVLAKSRRTMIMARYNATMFNLTNSPFNFTMENIMAMSELQLENYAIRFFFIMYARARNSNTTQLETMSSISAGALSSATVFNFVDLLFNISRANIFRAIREKEALLGIIVDTSSLNIHQLKEQIIKERRPLYFDEMKLSMLTLSYHIFRNGMDPTKTYNMTFYDFVENHLKPPMSFVSLLKMFSLDANRTYLMMKFKEYTFQEFCTFMGLRRYEIYTWTIKDFFKFVSMKILTDKNQCRPDPCARIQGVKCIDHPFGFTCKCPADKNLDANKLCADIDECKEKTTPPCRNHSHCVNTDGSYECKCNVGFEDKNGNCTDIDECKRDEFICHGGVNVNCTNTIGSFTCDCKKGYRFSLRYRMCLDINECVEDKPCNGKLHSYCKNKPAGYECKCPRGFKQFNDGDNRLVNCTDIDECKLGLHDCDPHASCTNNVGGFECKCNEGYKGDGKKCKAQKLFEPDPSKEQRFRGRGKISFPFDIFYNGKTHKKLYISTNGFISFGKRYRRRSPRPLKRLNKDLLAVFWAASSYSFFSGSVKYCVLQQGDPASVSLLEKVNTFVANSTMEKGFDASWALIVTWRNMIPYVWWWWWRFLYRSETNTFQLVIASNGSTTVAAYLYEDGGMKWNTIGRDAAVGYSKIKSDGFQVEGSFQYKIFDIDQQSFKDPAGNERKGCIVNVFKPTNPQGPSPEEKCLGWVRSESNKNNNWVNSLPVCPCTIQAIMFDRRFKKADGKDATCYVRRRRRNRLTKTCCYDEYGAVISRPDARAGRAYSRYPDGDRDAYNWCCEESTEYCDNFFQLRPSDQSCSDEEVKPCSCRWKFGFRQRRRRRRSRRPVRRGWFFGDPHITTFDGFKYSFNGLGDFVMIQTKDMMNVVHARTSQALHINGNFSKATIFSGFVLRSSENTTVQVFYDSNMDGNMSITTLNQSKHCQNFVLSAADSQELDGFQLTKQNNTLVVLFDSGLTAEITPGLGLLQIAFSIPANDQFNNKTEGLLGMLNEDKNDDLMYPNGTTISINSTDKEIFNYGIEWKVQDDEALFVNSTTCQKQSVFFNADFLPLFLSDYNITDDMKATCGGNIECMLDYLVTGNKAFAQATRKYELENEKIKKIFDNRPPTINTDPKEIRATAGHLVTVMVKTSDLDNDKVTLQVEGLPQGANFDNNTGNFTWTPTTGLEKVTIRFIATDSTGAASVYMPPIRYCDCKNITADNNCTFDTIQKSYANSSLELVACSCTDQFTGDQCETEVKPCEDSPCFGNVTCTPTTNPFGYKCGPCPDGMEGDGQVCNDFDECLNSTRNNCTSIQKCVNTIGSFRCDCKSGYVKNDKNKCQDVDECSSPVIVSKCKKNTHCNNTAGDYNCTCKDGYEGDPLKGCTDIDECQGDSQICFGHNCVNSPLGSYNCSCNPGYKIEKANGKESCKDIDECKLSITNDCEQKCANNPGSFSCACEQGFKLNNDKKTCSVDPGSKCYSNNSCQHLCTKSAGNITCHCRRGYSLASDGKKCEDVNECSNSNGGCSQQCNNYVGSYNCSCNSTGYLLVDKTTCEDIDECQKDNGGCEHKCTNSPPGSFHCSCKKGYQLKTSDNKTCEDINECKSTPDICSKYHTCNNNVGGYYCSCKNRRMFSNGKKKCKKSKRFKMSMRAVRVGRNDLMWKNDYNNKYSQLYKELINEIIRLLEVFFTKMFKEAYLGCTVLTVRQGSVLANVSVNFDADSNVTVADVKKSVSGLSNLGDLEVDPTKSAVSDMDECSDPTLNSCHKNATCTNELGSFNCTCKDGFKGDGFECKAFIPPSIPPTEPIDTSDGDDKTLMIVLLCVLIPLAIIIIIVIIWCCVKRHNKGNLKMDDNSHQMSTSNIYGRSNGQHDVHYDNNHGRRESDGSGEGGTYDIASATYYDNPTVVTESKNGEAAL